MSTAFISLELAFWLAYVVKLLTIEFHLTPKNSAPESGGNYILGAICLN